MDSETLGAAIAIINKSVKDIITGDQYVLDRLDGTEATYRALMRYWFLENGAADATPTELTALCDRWYELTRPQWEGGSRFYQPSTSYSSDGTKVGDNAGMSCAPSSNSVAGADDYAGNPLFVPTDVNVIIDADTREPVITAIDGINNGFKRYDPTVIVAVMQMTGYVCQEDEETTYTLWYSANQMSRPGCAPLSEAVRFSDNSIRPWVVHAKYANETVGGKLTSFSGAKPTSYNISHNTLHTLAAATGTGYSGMCYCDVSFLQLMYFIKYAKLSADGTMMQGCVDYNYQLYALVAEAGVKRILIADGDKSKVKVGSLWIIGAYVDGTGRDKAGMYSISGQAGYKVGAVETVTVEGTDYTAVYFDCSTAFDTAANGASTAGTVYMSSMGWVTGVNDNILGNDGNLLGNTAGLCPSTIQGIEYSMGKYECIADAILNLYKEGDDYYTEPYLVKNTAKQSTSVTSDYIASGHKLHQPASSGWQYVYKLGYKNGMFFAEVIGSTSSYGTKDGNYLEANATGTREALLFGYVNNGVGNGGLSYLNGNNGLSNATWAIASRISLNGSRGEWAA